MNARRIRLVTVLMMSGSALALAPAAVAQTHVQAHDAADARDAYCGPDQTPDRVCGPLADDGALERRGVGPNLERADGAASSAFRISVDGEGAADRGDRQRLQDLALAGAEVRAQVTALHSDPVLSVIADRPAVRAGDTVRFYPLANYAAFIERAELRIFRADQDVHEAPLTVIPVRLGAPVLWTPDAEPGERRYRYLLRVYDARGRYDETAAQALDFTHAAPAWSSDVRAGPVLDNLRVVGNIAVRGAAVAVSGRVTDPATRVSVFGSAVAVDRDGRFLAQQIAPKDTRAITVRLDPPGQAPIELTREIVVPEHDRLYVGILDVTAGHRSFGGDPELVGDHRRSFIDGRAAFYYHSRLNDWRVTASADTGERPLRRLFDGFLERDPVAVLRRIDPDRHYPVYGDDSTVVEDAPTYGQFYLRAETDDARLMWGVFQSRLDGNELIRHSRTLYGANVEWRNGDVTETAARRTEVSVFAADPGTISSREDFASTGGSVYYFRNQDIAPGTERVFLEVRDRESGLVLERRELTPARDYDVNYLQGRILLRQPPPITADASLFVHQSSLAGNPVWIVATYEYSPHLTRPDTLTLGGRAQHWLTDRLRVGASAYHQGEDQAEQDLLGADILYQHAPNTFIKLEGAQSDGAGNGALVSSTGGYDFTTIQTLGGRADALSLTFGADLDEMGLGARGRLNGYWRTREAGFSGPGELSLGAETLDQYGGAFDIALSDTWRLQGKGDVVDGRLTDRHALEAGVRREVADGWFGSLGVRSDKRNGLWSSYVSSHRPRLDSGERTDVAATLGYRHSPDPQPVADDEPIRRRDAPWSLSGFVQATVDRDEGRRPNDRYGVEGAYRFTDRLGLRAAVSDGDLGFGADARLDYAATERGSVYLGYVLAAENPDAYDGGRLGRAVGGWRQQMGQKTSLFMEQRYDHGQGPTGWSQAYGVDFTPFERWNFGLRYEAGTLTDALGYPIERSVAGATADYGGDSLRWASTVEIRQEDSFTLGERTTFFTRNQATYRASPSLRLFGKANIALSDSEQGAVMDADYTELGFGAAYRPVDNDRLNLLAKYTYLADLPSPQQVDALGQRLDFAQRSHIAAVDATWQATPRLAVGAKVAWRKGELRASRDSTAPWFDSEATFWAVRLDYEVVSRWDVLAEMRQLRVTEADDSRFGALVGVYRHVGDHLRVGAGYNFTDFSDNLGDLSYDERGWFVNVIAVF